MKFFSFVILLGTGFLAVTLLTGSATTALEPGWATTSMDYRYDYERVIVGTGLLNETKTFYWKVDSPYPVNIYFLDLQGYNDKFAGNSYTKQGLVEGVTVDEGSFDIPYADGWQMIIESDYDGQFVVEYTAWAAEGDAETGDGMCMTVLWPGVAAAGIFAVVMVKERY